MAIKFACDGCTKLMEESEAKHRGTVIVKQYCDECVKDVDAFLTARDAAHTAAAETYCGLMQRAVNEFYAGKPDGVLPDEHTKP